MRSLIADLGDAYCLELRRTAIGPFDVRAPRLPPPRRGSAAGQIRPLIGLEQALGRALPHNRLCGREGHAPARRAERPRATARSVAVGTFDGVHLGHREVIAGSDSVLTFEPHPVSVVAPQHTPKLLTTLEVKARADRRRWACAS